MPRFHFHVDDGTPAWDDVGTELYDEEAARQEAVRAAAEMLGEFDGRIWHRNGPWRMDVTDGDDRLLFSLRFMVEIPSGDVTLLPRKGK